MIFDAALTRSLAFAGPANYCPVLVGPLAGARWGVSAIAPRHLDHPRLHAVRDEVESAASLLAASWPS